MNSVRPALAAAVLLAACIDARCDDGALDPAFANGNGVFFPSYAYIGNPVVDDTARAVVIGPDQKITVIGDFLQDAAGADRDCGFLRTLPDASAYDPSFLPPNGYGYYSFNVGGAGVDFCHGLALDGSGGGYFVGSATLDHSGLRTGLIVRFGAAGLPDYSFFSDGVLESHLDLALALGAEDTEFRQVLVDSAGRAIVSGQTSLLTGDGVANMGVVLRLKADGTLDDDFFAGGPLLLIPNAADGSDFSIQASALDDDSGAWFVGERRQIGEASQVRLYRIGATGEFDASLGGSAGLALADCLAVQALAFDAEGRILLGCIPANPGRLPGVLRLAQGGSGWATDPTFGDQGHAELRLSAADQPALWPRVSRVSALAVVDRGRILVAGAYDPGRVLENPSDFFVARLRHDGSRDTSFGNDGVSRFDFGVGADRHFEAANAMALDAAGRPVVVGQRYSTDSGVSGYVVARLQQSPDAMFDHGFESP